MPRAIPQSRAVRTALALALGGLAAGAAAAASTAPELLRDVEYATPAHPEQRFDLHWPAATPRAVILFVHGGSLQESGERRSSPEYRDVCRPFVAAGLGCGTTDYRLAPAFQWPAMPLDVAAAVAKLREIVAARGVDPDRIVLFGHSSGCTLAASLGTNAEYLGAVGLTPRDLLGVVAMGCVLDLHDLALRRATADQIRAPFARDPSDAATFGSPEGLLSANPSRYVSNASAPTLVVVAEEERFRPPILEQGARFLRLLEEAGVAGELALVPGSHTSSIANLGEPGDPTFAAIVRFVDSRLAAAGEAE
jgi:acetyl esterase/lipase